MPKSPERTPGIVGQIKHAIDRTLGTINGPIPEEPVWNAYMERQRGWRELVQLVQQEDVLPLYQQRAMLILLAPDISRLPFKVNVDTTLKSLADVRSDWTDKLPPEQVAFVAELLPGYIHQARRAYGRDNDDRNARRVLFAYNDIIPGLLDKLPPEEAEKLFENFTIRDPISYFSWDEASGYNPLEHLYFEEGVSERWKKKAANQMHQVIKEEMAGQTRPREEHETALACYRYTLGIVSSGRSPLSREFFQEEIAFMLSLDNQEPILEQFHTGHALDLIDEPIIRRAFVRRQVLGSRSEGGRDFRVYDTRSVKTARAILKEFPDDTELVEYLKAELKSYKERSSQEDIQETETASREEQILQRMRRQPN